MPRITLVVCLHGEEDLLARLLAHVQGCYDDLIVIHDGPLTGTSPVNQDSASIAHDFSKSLSSEYTAPWREITTAKAADPLSDLVFRHGGRFFIGPRCFQQEPHWPFAWSQSKSDWILRLDADEYPSRELAKWLTEFRKKECIEISPSGYSCVWPLWNGDRATTRNWPDGRLFLFDRTKVSFIGMVEDTPLIEGATLALDMVLHHQPKRKSYGIRNVIFRRQAYRWRQRIAEQLVENPGDSARWRVNSLAWHEPWQSIRSHPIRHALFALIFFPLFQMRKMVKAGERPSFSASLNPALHHFLLGIEVFRSKRKIHR